MPDNTELETPDFLKEYVDATGEKLDEHLYPERTEVNRLVFPSPFLEYPGNVTTPVYLSARQYYKWWQKAGRDQPKDDDRHWSNWEYENRFHLILTYTLEGLDNENFNEDPLALPDQRIITWILTITQPLLEEAVNLPNLPKQPKGSTSRTRKSRPVRGKKQQ